MRVTDRSIDTSLGVTFPGANRGPIGVASTDDAAYLTWPDTRASIGDTGTEDAYFTRVRFADAAVVGSTGGASSLLYGLLGAAIALAVAGVVLFVVGRSRRSDPVTA